MKKGWWIAIGVVVLLLLIIFYPKYCGYREGGYVLPNPTYMQECDCFGLKYQSCGGKFDFSDCADIGVNYYCAGILMNKKCFEGVPTEFDLEWNKIECGKNRDSLCNVDEDCNFDSIVPFAVMRALSLSTDPDTAARPFD